MIIPKSQLVANINGEIVDNGTGQISPYDVRHNLIDIIDSVHLLTSDQNLNALNFSTPATRSTKAGEKTLEKLSLDGYFSTDNSAFGYAALKSNYQGVRNTAIGSKALNCNIYGTNNNALGTNALGGNTTGNGNVGIGNNTLINNKIGNFNIAIGNSAGYYVERNTSYKLFIASHPVESDYICDNPLGSGLIPLVYGDLNQNNLRFGIAVSGLHNESTLQVSGGIAPRYNNIDNIGTANYRFKNLYLINSIQFADNNSITYSSDNQSFIFNNTLVPSNHRSYNLGSNDRQWGSGHFYDIYVSGTAYIENYVRKTISNCEYECKTLYLASSGLCESEHGCGYLSDSELVDAGFIVKASGADYLRDYVFTFQPSGNDVLNLASYNIYSKSHWRSNISIHLDSGNHLKTDRVIGSGALALTTDPSGYGIYLNNENFYLSRENIIPPFVDPASGDIAGLGQVNIIQSSGVASDYNITIGSLESGVDISQKFINGIKRRTKDALNNNKDKLSGFELKYYDDSDTVYEGGLSDRFVIRSFDYSSDGINNLILMKNDPNGGVFGINNFTTGGDGLYPKTILNVVSKDNAVARIVAQPENNVYSALQLLGGGNCLRDGFETIYHHDSGIVDLNLYQDSGKINIYRFAPYQAGLFSSGNLDGTLTIGSSGLPYASVSLYDNVFSSTTITTPESGYSKLYNVKVNKEYANQSNALYFIDGSGWTHDLTTNKYDVLDGRSVYSEIYTTASVSGGNTYAGINCPQTRKDFLNDRFGNTGYGTDALRYLASGDKNTAIGLRAGSGINNGFNNVIIGAFSADTLTSGDNNIVLGTSSLYHCSGYINKNIIIGHGIGTNFNDNYKILIGYNNNILVSGSLGPNDQDKIFSLPTSGLLQVNNASNTQKTKLRYNSLEFYDDNNTYPSGSFSFNFSTASGVNTLLVLDNSVAPSGSGNYACSGFPYAELNGNLKILNNICFSDGTNLNSSSFLPVVDNLESSGIIFNNRLNSLFIEGIANQDINAPASSSNPTSGTIKTRTTNWNLGPDVTIKNRDPLLKINKNDYIIAIYINGEYRPTWVSSEAIVCNSCNP